MRSKLFVVITDLQPPTTLNAAFENQYCILLQQLNLDRNPTRFRPQVLTCPYHIIVK